MSVEEVERIMDETQDAIEYQRVRPPLLYNRCYYSKMKVNARVCVMCLRTLNFRSSSQKD